MAHQHVSVIPTAPALRMTNKDVSAPQDAERRWKQLPPTKRANALSREKIIQALRDHERKGVSRSTAIDLFCAQMEAGTLESTLLSAVQAVVKRGELLARSTLYSWANAYDKSGVLGLVDKHNGRARKDYGWEVRALYHYSKPTKPDMGTVAYWLQQEGFDTASYSRVRRYIKSLPETHGANSAQRVGRHYYKQNLGPHVMRTTDNLPVGFVYQGDGHNCDAYCAHPKTGKPWRPELTVWLDVRSTYCVGWWLSECESGVTTLYSLSHALLQHDHVPAMIHVDPGSGYKNKLITDDVRGYLARFPIEFMSALPGNAKGKGLVEGSFKHFRNRCDKQFPTYCGHDRSDDYLRHLTQKVKRGDIVLPTFNQYCDHVKEYWAAYNAQRADAWSQLQRTPVVLSADTLVRPRERCKVSRHTVRLFNRFYKHPDLAAVNGRWVIVEYTLHDDAQVSVYDDAGRLICDATQVDKKDWLPASRIEDLQQQRLRGQQKRLQYKLDEVAARSRDTIEHQAARIEAITDFDLPELEQQHTGTEADDIDFLSTDY